MFKELTLLRSRHTLCAAQQRFVFLPTARPLCRDSVRGLLAVVIVASCALLEPLPLTSRRGVLRSAAGLGVGAVLPPRAALALNVERAVAQLDAEATKRTGADFSSVVEIRPISGALGVQNALVILDAGNVREFDYVWIKDEISGKVLAVTTKAAPPYPLKASAARGGVIRPMAYSKDTGLYEGDTIKVVVADYRPERTFDGRPNGPIGINGKALYAPDYYDGVPSFKSNQ